MSEKVEGYDWLSYAKDNIEAKALRDYLNKELVWCSQWKAIVIKGKRQHEIHMPKDAMKYTTTAQETKNVCRDFRDGFKAAREIFQKNERT